MKLFNYLIALSFISILSTSTTNAQSDIINVGVRFQKASGLYWENGVDLEYSNKNILNDKLFFGFSYISSRLGTAFNSNAIKQDNYIFSCRYYARKDENLRPFSKFNIGYFNADYGSEIFDILDNTSLITALEFGLSYTFITKLKLFGSFGYNFISGNGMEGPGTLYPIFLQSTISWKL
mgnify:CR=1 FL=1